jgi:2-polyprenyl-3-methyl-5-hydroxy-6-metoxy-1,4-benzoquinol methylase
MNNNTGTKTLQQIQKMQAYNQWIFERISKFCRNRIFEAGCGIGTFTQQLKDRELVVGIDCNKKNIALSRQMLKKHNNVRLILDKIEDIRTNEYAKYQFDTILCLNVLEHVEDDGKALNIFNSLLAKNGRIVLQVPAWKFLFNSLDRNLSHHRRYTKKSLLKLTEKAGFVTEHCSFMNVLGMIGWFINGNILRKSILPANQLIGLNTIVPFIKQFDKLFNQIAGISIIYVGKKV